MVCGPTVSKLALGPFTHQGVSVCMLVRMGRTNVVIDDKLLARVMKLYGLRTKREAIDFALRSVAGSSDTRGLMSLWGIGWEGDIHEMRKKRIPDR